MRVSPCLREIEFSVAKSGFAKGGALRTGINGLIVRIDCD